MEVFISHKFEHLLLPNLPVKNSSAVLKDPSRPSISISHDKCKTDVPFFGWKPSLVKKNIHCIHCVVPENIHTATQREVRGSEVQEIPEGKGVGQ